MNSESPTARFSYRALHRELALVLRTILKMGSEEPSCRAPDLAEIDQNAIARLREAGLLIPHEDESAPLRWTPAGLRLLEAALCRGLEMVFLPLDIPSYDPRERVLRWKREPVKQWTRAADNQDAVLMAFEAGGWNEVISDPLLPEPSLDPKDRLRETVKSLNDGLKPGTIRFFTVNMGRGVEWKPV